MRALVRKFTETDPREPHRARAQFQSAPGHGRPRGAAAAVEVLEIVKLQALAARRVTTELKTHSIWSWGWATFSQAGIDPDKGEAVCVWLWARDPEALQRPRRGRAGDGRVADRRPARAARARRRLRAPAGVIRKSVVDPLARAIGDRDIAVSVVLERLVPAGGRARRARGPGRGARLRRRPLPRQRPGVPGRAAADPADPGRGARAAARRAAPRRRPGALPRAPALRQ